MAQDFRIMAPDQVRAVTVTNVSQSVALDVNVVSAMFSATLNIAPVVTVTSTLANPVWVTGAINSNFSASVTFPAAVSSTFSLSASQNYDTVIAQGLQGAAIQWNQGVGTGTVLLSVDGVNFSHESQFDLASGSFVYGSFHNGVFVVPSIAGVKTLRTHYEGVGSATGTLLLTYAPFTGHQSGSGEQRYISGAALITGTVTANVTGTITALTTMLHTSSTLLITGLLPTTSITILAENQQRLGATISNGSLRYPVCVLLGFGGDAQLYTVRIPPNGYYEVPFGYVGDISGATSGNLEAYITVTEVTQ